MARKKTPAKKPAKGVRITKGSKWTLTDEGGTHRQFKATVKETFVIGGVRVALISVPVRVPEKRKRKPRPKSKK